MFCSRDHVNSNQINQIVRGKECWKRLLSFVFLWYFVGEGEENMKTHRIGSVLMLLIVFSFVTLPAFATPTYAITLRLILSDQRVIWTGTFQCEGNLTLHVPESLYNMIVTYFGTDRFTAPTNLTFTLGGQIILFTLEITSDPPGWTITFQPISHGDVNGDHITDIREAAMIGRAWGATKDHPENYNMLADTNFDFQINIADAAVIGANWLKKY
jgi:hypothetical protein